MYLYVSTEDDFSSVPDALLSRMGESPIFVMELELDARRKLAREDVNKVIDNLKTQGFHLQMPPSADLILQRERAGKPH